jgi:hypothetical protein
MHSCLCVTYVEVYLGNSNNLQEIEMLNISGRGGGWFGIRTV